MRLALVGGIEVNRLGAGVGLESTGLKSRFYKGGGHLAGRLRPFGLAHGMISGNGINGLPMIDAVRLRETGVIFKQKRL